MIKKLSKQDYIVSDWSGGKTVQIAIGPEDAVYADRNFLWRVSSATVELKESDYTSLPDYKRFITPLNGEMILSHNGGTEININPLTIHEFDGADNTHCKGVCTDFNLMIRKGRCSGNMSVLKADSEKRIRIGEVEKNQILVLYVVAGAMRNAKSTELLEVLKDEALILYNGSLAKVFDVDPETIVISAQITI